MTIALATAANDVRLAALLAYMDTGSGVARVRVYGAARRATPNDAPGTPLIVEMPLLKPSATLSAGVMTLLPGAPGLNLITSLASWATVVNGNADVVFDCDVSASGGLGEIWLSTGGTTGLNLFEGGETTLSSGVLG